MFKVAVLILAVWSFSHAEKYKYVDRISCWSCEGGFQTRCANVTMIGRGRECGPYANCYEAIMSYNDGALKLVERRCFSPPNNDTALNFCNTPYTNPVGEILDCHACNTSNCNGHLIQATNYGHDGYFLMDHLQ